MSNLLPIEAITNKIYLIHGIKVMLDRDLGRVVWRYNKTSERTGPP